jgi:hypothetical protein
MAPARNRATNHPFKPDGEDHKGQAERCSNQACLEVARPSAQEAQARHYAEQNGYQDGGSLDR